MLPPNPAVPVRIVAPPGEPLSLAHRAQIRRQAIAVLIRPSRAPLLRVDVFVQPADRQGARNVLAYALRRDVFWADAWSGQLGATFGGFVPLPLPPAVQRALAELRPADLAPGSSDESSDSKGSPGALQVALTSSTPELGTTAAALAALRKLFESLGFGVHVRTGKFATRKALQALLAADLPLLVHIGHGTKTGLLLWDGVLTDAWFKSLTAHALAPSVIYFNSCLVFNPPLEPAVVGAGSRTYLGGQTLLSTTTSPPLCRAWVEDVLVAGAAMHTALDKASAAYTKAGTVAMAGDGGKFLPIPTWGSGIDM